jgi:hypothetical protein
MEIGKLLSLKDFFNYYIAGIIWLLNFVLISSIFGVQPVYAVVSNVFIAINNLTSSVISIVLSIIIPYTVGFALSKSGNFITKGLRKWRGNPHYWLLDYSDTQKNNHFAGRRLPKSAVERVQGLAPRIFGYELTNPQKPWLWFYQILTYVRHKGGPASDIANRAFDLANLTESLLLPLPILFGIVAYSLTSNIHFLIVRIGIVSVVVLLFFYLLLRRYEELNTNAIKHIYRAFLVIAPDELRQDDKRNKIETTSSIE